MEITLINPSLTPFNYFNQKPIKNPSISHFFTQKTLKKSHLFTPHTKIHQINSLPTQKVTNFATKKHQKTRYSMGKQRVARTQIAATTTTMVATLWKNPTFVSGLMALVVAQGVKVAIYVMVEKKWKFKFCYSSGGMPSSHSALCTGLTTAVGMCNGVGDGLFAVCLGFSLIVMYDAIGVRRHAGMQAQVLNKIIEDLFQGHPISERKLKELLGHTPSQVVAGALLGIAVAWYCCRGCLAPI